MLWYAEYNRTLILKMIILDKKKYTRNRKESKEKREYKRKYS